MPDTAQTRPPTPRRSRWGVVPCAALAFLAAALPLILIPLRRARGQFDEEVYHLPTIRRFAAQLARGGGGGSVDLSDYLSATTPGYHLALAALSRAVGDGLILLKLANALITVALFVALERALRHRIAGAPRPHTLPPFLHLALIAPFAASMYVFLPGVWLQPDNPGWLGVLAILLIALRPKWDWLSLTAGGAVMFLLVWTRQAHVWAAGVLWAAAWIGGAARAAPSALAPSLAFALGTSTRWFARPTRDRLIRAALALAVTLPALVSLAWFHHLWHGLTPPSFRQQHGGACNPATPAFAMSLFAIYSAFFGAWVWPGLTRLWTERRAGGWLILVPCALIGILAAALPVTTFTYEARATGLWNIVKFMDARNLSFGLRTSPVLLVLAPAGMVALAAWLVQLPRRRAWVYGLALLGFVAAQTANTNAWQRYLEPMLLMTLALMAADLAARPSPPYPPLAAPPRWLGGPRSRWAGPAILGLLGAMLTAFTLWSEPVFVKNWPDHPLARPISEQPAAQPLPEPATPNRR